MEFKVDHEEEVARAFPDARAFPARLLIKEASVDISVDEDMPLDLSGKLPCQISYVDNDIHVETHESGSGRKVNDAFSANFPSSSSSPSGGKSDSSVDKAEGSIDVDSDASSIISDSSIDSSNAENVVEISERKESSEVPRAFSTKKKGKKPAGRSSKMEIVQPGRRKHRSQLWQFLRNLLLKEDDSNVQRRERLMIWVDREKGIFRIQQTDKLGRLWGIIKNNPTMTYEKLSRAMRYYYKSKILTSIPGRRLTFQFGSRATGWKKTE